MVDTLKCFTYCGDDKCICEARLTGTEKPFGYHSPPQPYVISEGAPYSKEAAVKIVLSGSTSIPHGWALKLVRETSINLSLVDLDNSNLNFLSFLTHLTHLDISGTTLRDIEFVRNMSNLQVLNIEDTNVSDLSPLLNCKELTHLNIIDTKVTRIPPLFMLSKLEFLEASGTDIEPSQLEMFEIHMKTIRTNK